MLFREDGTHTLFRDSQEFLLALGSWIAVPYWQRAESATIHDSLHGIRQKRYPLTLPYCHPFTNNNARYGWPDTVFPSYTKDIMTSDPVGTSRSKVVTKKPTPACPEGRPSLNSRLAHVDVSKPGRCQPCRSPNKPPSFNTPRTLSGYL